MKFIKAGTKDIPFIAEVYHENIQALHGVYRGHDTWKKLMSDTESIYYIVALEFPVAWFRVDYNTPDVMELGMLQVKPDYQHQGVGRYIISTFEMLARQNGIKRTIIHTTEDNYNAQMLYASSGYSLVEIGPCTTADGCERIGYTYQKILS